MSSTNACSRCFCFADVAVTPTAAEFTGIYRNKQHHEPDFDAILDRASQSCVKHVLLTGMSLRNVDFILDICKRRPEMCKMTVGVHPYHAQEPWDEAPNYFGVLKGRVRELVARGPSSPLRAFGELGLDFDRTDKACKQVQIWAFKAQLDMIVEEKWDLPLFLHCRSSASDFIEIITPYMSKLPRSGLVHSFVGTVEEMHQLVALGLDVSVNGFSLQDPASIEMVKALPLNKLQIETDSPWGYINPNGELARTFPAPNRIPVHQTKKRDKFELGKMVKERNESCLIVQVAAIVAGLKGIEITLQTGHRSRIAWLCTPNCNTALCTRKVECFIIPYLCLQSAERPTSIRIATTTWLDTRRLQSTTMAKPKVKTTLMSLSTDILIMLPGYLCSIEDYTNLSSTCRRLRSCMATAAPNTILHLAAAQSTTFLRPSPHFLVMATARELGNWARQSVENEASFASHCRREGIDGMLKLALTHCGLTIERIRELYEMRMSIINPVTDIIDKCVGPQWYNTPDFWHGGVSDACTIESDPTSTFFHLATYGELFAPDLDHLLTGTFGRRLSVNTRLTFVRKCIPETAGNVIPPHNTALRWVVCSSRWRPHWKRFRTTVAGCEDFKENFDDRWWHRDGDEAHWRQRLYENVMICQGLEGLGMVRPKLQDAWVEKCRQWRARVAELEREPAEGLCCGDLNEGT
ncbi:hypothetical protein BST61_g2741 [Cercospora zeina]